MSAPYLGQFYLARGVASRNMKRNWKQVGLAMLLGILTIGVLGCGNKSDGGESTGSPSGNASKKMKVGIVFDSGGKDDKSFNASAWRGIERAMTDFSIEEAHIESKSEKDYESNLAALADSGCEVIFSVGINTAKALEAVAPKYPKVKFAIIDGVVDQPNVRSLLFNEEQGSFLAGYLAGLMTKTNKIGFVGGMEIDLIKKFYSGYAAGAYTANPKVEILPDKYAGSWNDADLAKTAAVSLFTQRADIVYHAAGKAGIGVFNAAKESGKHAIGVDSDQDEIYPGVILTSMIKRVDESVYSTIKDVLDEKFTPGSKVYDLAAGGVGLSEMKYTKDLIGKEKIDKVNAAAEEIKAGKIKVPTTKSELDSYRAGLQK